MSILSLLFFLFSPSYSTKEKIDFSIKDFQKILEDRSAFLNNKEAEVENVILRIQDNIVNNRVSDEKDIIFIKENNQIVQQMVDGRSLLSLLKIKREDLSCFNDVRYINDVNKYFQKKYKDNNKDIDLKKGNIFYINKLYILSKLVAQGVLLIVCLRIIDYLLCSFTNIKLSENSLSTLLFFSIIIPFFLVMCHLFLGMKNKLFSFDDSEGMKDEINNWKSIIQLSKDSNIKETQQLSFTPLNNILSSDILFNNKIKVES